jgi:hypothetical protein
MQFQMVLELTTICELNSSIFHYHPKQSILFYIFLLILYPFNCSNSLMNNALVSKQYNSNSEYEAAEQIIMLMDIYHFWK